LVHQGGSGRCSDIQIDALDGAANLDRRERRDRAFIEGLEAMIERRAIAQGLFGCWVGLGVWLVGEAKQTVARRDDILDLRTRLRLEQGNRVDQNGLVRDQLSRRLEFRQGGPRLDASLEHGLAFEVSVRRKKREVVVGSGWVE
jgi:hypothetical protein